jgi:ketosteroid isomerase-like protein
MTNTLSILAICLFPAAFASSAYAQNANPIPVGIEKSHKDDITATIAPDVDALTALWDDDAVLLQPGTPPIVGKAAFHDFMKQALAKSAAVKVVEYVPDIRDIQVAANVAYEWGYFEAAQKSSESQAPPKASAPSCFAS